MDKGKIEIINYDSIVGEEDKKFNIPQIKMPNSFIINGCRGSGKTNLLLNFLISNKGKAPLIYYDKIYIFTPTKDQKKYKFISDYFKEVDIEIDKEIKKKYNRGEQDNLFRISPGSDTSNTKSNILTITDDYNELPQIKKKEDKDKKKENNKQETKLPDILIILDDCITLMEKDAVFYQLIKNYYIMGRHLKYSPMFLTQKYNKLDTSIRDNSMINMFVGHPSKSLLLDISSSIPLLDYKGWKKIFNDYVDNNYDFIFVDTFENDINRKIWINNLNDSVELRSMVKELL